MTTGIWAGMLLLGAVMGLMHGQGAAVWAAATAGAGEAVTVAGSLVGKSCFFLGWMRLAEACGLAERLGRVLQRPLGRLFSSVRGQEEALPPMAMNLAANLLGMGNAATPFGLEAMAALARQNRTPGRANEEMCLFVLLNTAGVCLLPTNILALRAAAGAVDGAGIAMGGLCVGLAGAAVSVGGGWLLGRRR